MENIMTISFHWPHDRFALGWDWIRPNFEFNYHTFTVYLLICTIDINI